METSTTTEARPAGRPALFSAPEACRRAGVTYRMLDYWCRTDVIVPAVPSRGSGSQRRFSAEQVRALAVVGRLSKLGASASAMRCAVATMEAGPLDLDGFLVVTPADGCSLSWTPGSALGPDGAGWIIDLGTIPEVT